MIYLDEDRTVRVGPEAPATSRTSNGYLAETQYLYREEIFNAILGGGYYRLNQATETEDLRTRARTEHGNAYLYARILSPVSATWTLGLSGDIFDRDAFLKKRSQVNPKVGLLWNIGEKTVFRAAWFMTFNRSSSFNQTLEPTQVAGFNQFFDDPIGTKTERWGVGIDHRFSPVLTGGGEISQRHLEDTRAPPLDIESRWEESLYRAYLQLTPHPRWAAAIEYSRENFDNLESFGALSTELKLSLLVFRILLP